MSDNEHKGIFEAYLEDNKVKIKLHIDPSNPLVSFAHRLLSLEIDNRIKEAKKPQIPVVIPHNMLSNLRKRLR